VTVEEVPMFVWPIVVTCAVLAGAWVVGGARMLAAVATLAVLEVSMSFDNAVVDATVLRKMSHFWQRMFLTVGVLLAVLGMRFLLPLLCVSIATGLPPQAALGLVVHDKTLFRHVIDEASPVLMPFGETYLLMVFLDFVLESREVSWLRPAERALARLGRLENSSVVIAILTILLCGLADGRHHLTILVSGLAGLATYLAVNGIAQFVQPAEVPDGGRGAATGARALILFLYLEILDASFSFDGVIGAFAISHDLLVIATGLGIGACFVRSLTVQLVRRGVLTEFVYLEHGAHWAIGALAVTMIVKFRYHLDGTVTGLISITFILIALVSSARARRYIPAHARETHRAQKPHAQRHLSQEHPGPRSGRREAMTIDERFALLDHGGNGTLEHEDLEGLALRVVEGLGEPVSSPKGTAVLRGIPELWRALLRCSDADGDERISREEFGLALETGRLITDAALDRTVRRTVQAILDLCDSDGNGELDQRELGDLLALCGVPADQAPRIFAEIDTDGSGAVSVEELTEAAHRLLIV
jgi:Ca2+-binding EF-hand superfamily protein